MSTKILHSGCEHSRTIGLLLDLIAVLVLLLDLNLLLNSLDVNLHVLYQ